MRIEKILIIAPSTEKKWKGLLKNKLGCPPIGVASLSSILKMHGYETKIIDMLVEYVDSKRLAAIIEAFQPDVVAMSASYTESVKTAYKITKYIKKHYPVPILAGGVHVTFRPYEALANGCDVVVMNEGESTLIELFEALKWDRKDMLKQLKGIAYIDEEKGMVVNDKQNYITHLDSLPLPDLLGLPLTEYITPFAIITSRGCPGDCIYCSSRAMSGRQYRMRSAESVVSEIYYLSTFVLNDLTFMRSYIAIYDDTFTVHRKRLKTFCKYMIESGLNVIPWKCESRIDVLDKELLGLMKKAGCFAIHVGIESSSQAVVDSLKKKVSLVRVEELLSDINDVGLQPLCSFIIGNHSDNRETMDHTIEFMKRIIFRYNARVAASPNTPLPGTELFENNDLYKVSLKSSNWEDYSLMKCIISTEHLSEQEIRDYYYQINRMLDEMETAKSD